MKMTNRFITWCEVHRDQIGTVLRAAGTGIQLVMVMLVRTIAAAGAMVAYLFYTATPDTTLYMLAQFAHRDQFWFIAILLAFMYSYSLYIVTGSARRGSGGVAMYAGGCRSGEQTGK